MGDDASAASDTAPGIDELVVGDQPEAWRHAGFTVDDDDVCRIGTVRVRLAGRDEGKYIRSWTLRGVQIEPGVADVDGLSLGHSRALANGPAEPDRHDNGARLIDHLVVATPDTARTTKAFEAIGLDVRRVRDTDPETYGLPMRQTFFRLGEVILELIGPAEPAGDGPARFFGLALTVDDLDACRPLRRAPRPRQGRGATWPAHRHAAPPGPRPVGGDRVHGRRCRRRGVMRPTRG